MIGRFAHRHRRVCPYGRSLLVLLALWLFALPSSVLAQRACTIFLSSLQFGVYMPGTPVPLDSRSWILVRCVGRPGPGQPSFYTIRIDGGSSGDPSNRLMQAGTGQLGYNIFQNAARTTIWGDGTAGTTPVSGGMGGGFGFGNRRWYFHRVYGRSYAAQDPAPGSYVDSPIVTIEF